MCETNYGDQGSKFVPKEFLGSEEAAGRIQIIQKPSESPAPMYNIERNHAPLRAAYDYLRIEKPNRTPEDLIEMSLYCLNSTACGEDHCTTLSVFRAMSRTARNTPARQQLEPVKAFEIAMEDVSNGQKRERSLLGLNTMDHTAHSSLNLMEYISVPLCSFIGRKLGRK